MKEIKAQSWEDFQRIIADFRYKFGHYHIGSKKLQGQLAFRGQSNSEWGLRTTLERTAGQVALSKYFLTVEACLDEIQSFSGERWNHSEFEEARGRKEDWSVSELLLPAYGYLIYLRHHGFPSPLLDWSESPYVAAFFSFAEESPGDAAVFCYAERPRGAKVGEAGLTSIDIRGHHAATHKRHFSQQALYTVATRYDIEKRQRIFSFHEEVFGENRDDQDALWKIILPGSLRPSALKTLAEYNLNFYTLFQTEESLVRSLALKHYGFKDA